MKKEELLMKLGIYPHLKGFRYIIDALEMIGRGDDVVEKLYQSIAFVRKVSKYSVERDIRYALSQINEDCGFYQKYMANCPKKNLAVLVCMNYGLKAEEEKNGFYRDETKS